MAKHQGVFVRFVILAIGLMLVPTGHTVGAAGMPPGTVLTNQAVVSYATPTGGERITRSNVVTTVVDENVCLDLTSQDGAPIYVLPGDSGKYFTLQVTNTGNGTETFPISADTAVAGDQFDPVPVGIFLDSNRSGLYDPGIDQPLSDDGLTLPPDRSTRIFIVNDIPLSRNDGTDLADRDRGSVFIRVANDHGPGRKGTGFADAGDGGSTAVYCRDFPMRATLSFLVKAIAVKIAKTAFIRDQFGGERPYPGATITYVMDVSASGSGTANDLVFRDSVPEHTTYRPGSLTLDGEPLSDAVDNDSGEVSGSPVNLITVRLEDQKRGSRTITFDVTID